MRGEQPVDHRLEAGHLRLDAGEAVDERHIAERVGGALGKLGVVFLHQFLQRFGLAHHERSEGGEHGAENQQHQSKPPVEDKRKRQQHKERHERRQIVTEEGKPEPEQRVGALQHDLHQPPGMGARMVGERQLQHVLEIVGEYALALCVREPVGIERNQRAAADIEQAEGGPTFLRRSSWTRNSPSP